MKKLTMSLIGLAFVLCAFSAQAAATPIGGNCTATAECNDGNLLQRHRGLRASSVMYYGHTARLHSTVYTARLESCNEANDNCAGTPPACPADGLYCNGVESCNEANDNCAGTPPAAPAIHLIA